MSSARALPQKTCFKCKYEATTEDARCSRCGGVMRSRGTIRALGFVMVVLGGGIVAVMGTIILWALNLVAGMGDPNAASRFTGTRNQMLIMFVVFGFVLIFGLAALTAGLWQLIFGRRNAILVWIVLALGAVFLVVGLAFDRLWGT